MPAAETGYSLWSSSLFICNSHRPWLIYRAIRAWRLWCWYIPLPCHTPLVYFTLRCPSSIWHYTLLYLSGIPNYACSALLIYPIVPFTDFLYRTLLQPSSVLYCSASDIPCHTLQRYHTVSSCILLNIPYYTLLNYILQICPTVVLWHTLLWPALLTCCSLSSSALLTYLYLTLLYWPDMSTVPYSSGYSTVGYCSSTL